MANLYGTFKTPKGTELPLLNLKGKPYLQVAHRLVWFREVFPLAAVKTQMISLQGEGDDNTAIFRCEIYLPTTEGKMDLVATAHKSESKRDFRDGHIEKSESGSIGRCLALIGFGTQFTGDELDEGSRLADSPIAQAKPATSNGSFRKPKLATAVSKDDDI